MHQFVPCFARFHAAGRSEPVVQKPQAPPFCSDLPLPLQEAQLITLVELEPSDSDIVFKPSLTLLS